MEIDLKTLAQQVGGRLDGPADLRIDGVAGVEHAGPGQCTYVAHPRYLAALATTRAAAVLLVEGVESPIPAVRVEDPARAFLLLLEHFAMPRAELFPPGIHPSAVIDPSAVLGTDVHVGANAVIGPGCSVGDRSVVGATSVLLHDVEVGADCLLYSGVQLREKTVVGHRVILHCGVVLGSDGFGFAPTPTGYHKIPQIGRVVVGDDVEIGANVCVDRATAGETVIGAGSKIDNLVQIAHNVRIGSRTAISAQTGIAGSCTIGDDVVVGGQVGLADHLQIGDRVRIGAKSGVSNDLDDDATVSGIPTRPHRDWRRQQAHIARLERYASEITALRRRVEALEKETGAAPTENS
jgi:UDP-3-O-[3-hydroxymyristoyl] glucosamine N-acyltransferase